MADADAFSKFRHCIRILNSAAGFKDQRSIMSNLIANYVRSAMAAGKFETHAAAVADLMAEAEASFNQGNALAGSVEGKPN